jgi:hypothetical protein
MASFVLLPQVQLALSLVLQLFLPAQHSSLEFNLLPLLCGFKLLVLLVNSFPDVINVIPSNNTVLEQRKKLYWCKLHNSCNLQESCFSSGFKTCMLLFSWFLELVDFSANPVNVMCNNFLHQMQIDALEQLISEDVKVQGQIVHDGFRTCLMVFRIVARFVTGWVRSTSTTLLLGSSLEESGLTSMRVDRLFLRVEEKYSASPWRASLESANLGLARV